MEMRMGMGMGMGWGWDGDEKETKRTVSFFFMLEKKCRRMGHRGVGVDYVVGDGGWGKCKSRILGRFVRKRRNGIVD